MGKTKKKIRHLVLILPVPLSRCVSCNTCHKLRAYASEPGEKLAGPRTRGAGWGAGHSELERFPGDSHTDICALISGSHGTN